MVVKGCHIVGSGLVRSLTQVCTAPSFRNARIFVFLSSACFIPDLDFNLRIVIKTSHNKNDENNTSAGYADANTMLQRLFEGAKRSPRLTPGRRGRSKGARSRAGAATRGRTSTRGRGSL